MGRRYDSQEYIDAWKASRTYPKIHDNITAVAANHIPEGETVLDLCSSIGLLGRRLADFGYTVCAVDGDTKATDRGKAAGVYDEIPLYETFIDADTLPDVAQWIADQGVSAVVARRCVAQVWEAFDDHLAAFTAALYGLGVRRWVIEGMAPWGDRSTHPIPDVNAEALLLARYWPDQTVIGQCAVLLD